MFEEGPLRRFLHNHGPLSKGQTYDSHIVVYKSTEEGSWSVTEFPNENEAIEKYEELVAQGMDTVIMAKRVRKHVG